MDTGWIRQLWEQWEYRWTPTQRPVPNKIPGTNTSTSLIGLDRKDVQECIAEVEWDEDDGAGIAHALGLYHMKDGRFLFLVGGDDATGACCGLARIYGTVTDSLEDMLALGLTDEERRTLKVCEEAPWEKL